MVEMRATGLPHVLKVWLGLSKCMLPVGYTRSIKTSSVLVKFHGDHKRVTKLKQIWPPLFFGIQLDLRQWCLSGRSRLALQDVAFLPSQACLPVQLDIAEDPMVSRSAATCLIIVICWGLSLVKVVASTSALLWKSNFL